MVINQKKSKTIQSLQKLKASIKKKTKPSVDKIKPEGDFKPGAPKSTDDTSEIYPTQTRSQVKKDKFLHSDLINNYQDSVIYEVMYGYMSHEQLDRTAEVIVTNSSTNIQDPESLTNTLYDLRMGAINDKYVCTTCGFGQANCPGHNGMIKLNEPLINPMRHDKVRKVYELICRNCKRLLVTKTQLEQYDLLRINDKGGVSIIGKTGDKRLSAILSFIRGGSVCPHEGCGMQNGTKVASKEDQNILKAENYIVTASEILQEFDQISDEDARYMGFGSQSHPRDLILQSIYVLPPRFRPYNIINGTETIHHEYTMAYASMVDINNKIGEKNAEIENLERNAGTSTTVASSGSIDNKKSKKDDLVRVLLKKYREFIKAPAVKTGKQPNNNKNTTIFSGIGSKSGLIRGSNNGKRVNNSARSVLSPDPTLRFNQVRLPKKFADTMSCEENIFAHNLHKMQALLNKGRITEVTPGSDRIQSDGTRIKKNSSIHVIDKLKRLSDNNKSLLRTRYNYNEGSQLTDYQYKLHQYLKYVRSNNINQFNRQQFEAFVMPDNNITGISDGKNNVISAEQDDKTSVDDGDRSRSPTDSDGSRSRSRRRSRDMEDSSIPSTPRSDVESADTTNDRMKYKDTDMQQSDKLEDTTAINNQPPKMRLLSEISLEDYVRVVNLENLLSFQKTPESFDLRKIEADPAPTINLRVGDRVQRLLHNGDNVVFNRQPTLSKYSMMSASDVVIRDTKTIGLQMSYTKPMNADFDGDEGNVFALQGYKANIEAIVLSNVKNCIIDAGDSNVAMGLVFDNISASFIITSDYIRVNMRQFSDILANTDVSWSKYTAEKQEFTIDIDDEDEITKKRSLVGGDITNVEEDLDSDDEDMSDDEDSQTDVDTRQSSSRRKQTKKKAKERALEILYDDSNEIKITASGIERFFIRASELNFKVYKGVNVISDPEDQAFIDRYAVRSTNDNDVEYVLNLKDVVKYLYNIVYVDDGGNVRYNNKDDIDTTKPRSGILNFLYRNGFSISGHLTYSIVLPRKMSYRKYDDNNHVVVRDGYLLSGQLTKKHIGPTKNSFIQVMYNDFGSQVTADFLSDASFMLNTWLPTHELTIGTDDCRIYKPDIKNNKSALQVEKEFNQFIEKEVQNAMYKIEELDVDTKDSYEQKLQEKKKIDALQETTDIISKKIKELIQNDKSLQKHNQLYIMSHSGAKGSDFNVTQIAGQMGLQIVNGARITRTMNSGKRTLPYFLPGTLDPREQGFVVSNFLKGLNPYEMVYHAMAGREGLIDTANKTEDIGTFQRKITKTIEGLVMKQDGTIRNSKDAAVSLTYGGDNLDPQFLEQTVYGRTFINIKRLEDRLNESV